MLHAELHGKLSPDADDSERREDILTSTVFGTLFAAGAWDVLLAWLRRAESVRDGTNLEVITADERRYWFWPYLNGAEPDLLLRIGSLLAITEAKYNSEKSGDAADLTPQGTTNDQLVREWHACSSDAIDARYPSDLRDAIHACTRVVVFLVRRGRWANALRDAKQSAALDADAQIYLLSWEHLDEVIALRPETLWLELKMYLQRRGLSAFRGFRTAISAGHQPRPELEMWAGMRRPAARGIRSAFSTCDVSGIRELALHSRHIRPSHGQLLSKSFNRLNAIASLAARQSRFSAKGRP